MSDEGFFRPSYGDKLFQVRVPGTDLWRTVERDAWRKAVDLERRVGTWDMIVPPKPGTWNPAPFIRVGTRRKARLDTAVDVCFLPGTRLQGLTISETYTYSILYAARPNDMTYERAGNRLSPWMWEIVRWLMDEVGMEMVK